ncbi:MAG: M23 family metallopeptidase [Bacillota bacterium]|nr:M23 family metallopeptidase [Bacillota bacterium]
MRDRQRLLRAFFGHGYDLMAAGGRALRRAAAHRRAVAAALVCFIAGFAAGFLGPLRAPGPSAPAPVTPAPVGVGENAAPAGPASLPAGAPQAQPDRLPQVESLQAASDFRLPLAGRVTAGFGWRRDPVFGDFRFHPGIDLAGRPGQAIEAAAGGKVVEVRTAGSDYGREPAGWEVAVQHPGGWVTRYRFAGEVRVRLSQTVARGQPLGVLGAPGALHFALYRGDQAHRPPAPEGVLPEG